LPPHRFDEAAVHTNHASSTFASPTIEVEISYERAVGEVVALAACAMGLALSERANGGLRPLTKQHGTNLLEQLYTLRQARPDIFDAVARREGTRVLHARYAQLKGRLNGSCPPFNETMANEMIEWPIAALHRIVAAEMN
jgi:hypothetical protein